MNKSQTRPTRSVRLYSINDLIEEFSVSRPTVNRLVYGGFLKTVRVGRAVRIPESAVLDFIEKGGERNIQESK